MDKLLKSKLILQRFFHNFFFRFKFSKYEFFKDERWIKNELKCNFRWIRFLPFGFVVKIKKIIKWICDYRGIRGGGLNFIELINFKFAIINSG